VLGLLRNMASAGAYTVATINNESREMNRYRIQTFALRGIFTAFFTSCYVGVPKPAPRIYEIALDVMHVDPAASLFVDDRAENVESARALGIQTVQVTDPRMLSAQLLDAGVQLAAPRG
jgi:putative hydrolase of the HAD superfamily